jgi:hypothetical protein
MTKHTVLFVGKFDPPHINHVRAASAIMRHSDVESVWIFPLASDNDKHVRNMCTIWCADMSLGGEKPVCCTAGLDKGLATATEAWEWTKARFPALDLKMAMFEKEFDFADDDKDAVWSSYTIKTGGGRVTANLGGRFIVLNFPSVPPDLVERIKGGSNESRNFIAPIWDYLQKHRLYRTGGKK